MSSLLTVHDSYPETNQLSLEEIDYLFITQGNRGTRKFLSKAGPVQISLKPKAQIEDDIEREVGSGEVKGAGREAPLSGETEHNENGEIDEKSSDHDGVV